MWQFFTFFGILLLPRPVQWIIEIAWAGLALLALINSQFLAAGVLALTLVFYLSARHRLRRGKNFLGQSLGRTIESAPRWAARRFDEITARFQSLQEQISKDGGQFRDSLRGKKAPLPDWATRQLANMRFPFQGPHDSGAK